MMEESTLAQLANRIKADIAAGRLVDPAKEVADAIVLRCDYEKYLQGQCADVSGELGKQLLQVIQLVGWGRVDNSEVARLIDEAITENPKAVEQYRSGKMKGVGFFIGQIKKKNKDANFNMEVLTKLIEGKLMKGDESGN